MSIKDKVAHKNMLSISVYIMIS